MTDTIHNVPRDDLDLIRAALEGFKPCIARDDALRTVRALLSATSPAGVDGLGDTAKLLLPALRQYMHNDGSGLLAGYDLETTQAIIDWLRGEVADLLSMLATVSKAGLRVRTERDQQAQRIGDLEGLLRAESARVDFLDAYIVTADAPDTGKATMLADYGTLRECIDFALSAGKEGE